MKRPRAPTLVSFNSKVIVRTYYLTPREELIKEIKKLNREIKNKKLRKN